MLKISVRNSRFIFSPTGVSLNTPTSQLLIGGLQHRVRGTLPKVPSGIAPGSSGQVEVSQLSNRFGSNTKPSVRGLWVLKGPVKLGLPGHSKPRVLPCSSVSLQLLIKIGRAHV